MPPWSPAGKVDVEHILEILEVENLRPEGIEEFRFSCPYPVHMNGDMNASAYMNRETTAWYCHGCKRKAGSCIPFVAFMLNISPIKAKKALREAYDPSSFNIDDRDIAREIRDYLKQLQAPKKKLVENPVLEESHAKQFGVDWPQAWCAWSTPGWESFEPCDYMFERGFEPETLEDWGFGYDEYTQRVTFQVRDHEGRLVGFKGRATDGREPKYLSLGDAPDRNPRYGYGRYLSGNVVFGLHEARKHSKTIIVCEGELNAVALWQMGFKNSVALNGSRLTRRQGQLLRRYADEIIMYFDFDKAGEEGMWGYENEKGYWVPGAIDVLSKDCDVKLVQADDNDAADWMAEGQPEKVEALISSAKHHFVVALDLFR